MNEDQKRLQEAWNQLHEEEAKEAIERLKTGQPIRRRRRMKYSDITWMFSMASLIISVIALTLVLSR